MASAASFDASDLDVAHVGEDACCTLCGLPPAADEPFDHEIATHEACPVDQTEHLDKGERVCPDCLDAVPVESYGADYFCSECQGRKRCRGCKARKTIATEFFSSAVTGEDCVLAAEVPGDKRKRASASTTKMTMTHKFYAVMTRATDAGPRSGVIYLVREAEAAKILAQNYLHLLSPEVLSEVDDESGFGNLYLQQLWEMVNESGSTHNLDMLQLVGQAGAVGALGGTHRVPGKEQDERDGTASTTTRSAKRHEPVRYECLRNSRAEWGQQVKTINDLEVGWILRVSMP